jgi:hypothetical protein
MESDKETSQITENLLFPKIFQAFRIAIQPSKLLIAFSAIAIICLAGRIMDVSKSVAADKLGEGIKITELQIYLHSPERLESFIESNAKNGEATGVFVTLWNFAREKFNGALNSLFKFDLPGVATNIGEYFKGIGWAVKYHWFYCILFAIIKLAVIGVAGGGICRIAALQFARGEKQGISEALRYSRSRFWSFFITPIAPLAVIIFISLFVFLLGMIGNIWVLGELLMGILMPFVLLAGALITIVLIGTFAGFNLMYPAIAYDGSDCFDAISRSFNYIYTRPWRMGLYTATAAVYGAICYIFVRFFAFLLLGSSWIALRLGVWTKSGEGVNKLRAIWPEPTFINLVGTGQAATGVFESIAAFLVYICLLVIIGLLVSFLLSFYFTANTIIYSLLRNRVDKTLLDDIFVPAERTEATEAAEEKTEETEPQKQQPAEEETKKEKQSKKGARGKKEED